MKLWGGRFAKEPSDKFIEFESSLKFDRRLAPYDIEVNRAWAKMLARINVFSESELKKILGALEETSSDFKKGRIDYSSKAEDVHTLVEERLFTYAGSAAKKLPAGRSRNELVSADVRLYLRDSIDYILGEVKGLQRRFLSAASRYARDVMPSFTHMQQATPVTVGHFILSYFWKFERDRNFLKYVREEVNVSPLGSGAAGGTTLPVDQEFLRTELLFGRTSVNSMDATSDRDFIVLFLEAACGMQIHLSGICEDMIIFSTPYFGYVKLPEEYSTGSSLMPQKKNPDMFELVRGRTGRIIGNLMAMLNLLKGLPSGYNRDLQEDKPPLFDSIDRMKEVLRIFPAAFSALEFDTERIKKSVAGGEICAQALAEFLVTKGVAFRDAHEITGRIIRDNESYGRKMSDLKMEELKAYSPEFSSEALPLLEASGVLNQLATASSPSPLNFESQLRMAYEAAEE